MSYDQPLQLSFRLMLMLQEANARRRGRGECRLPTIFSLGAKELRALPLCRERGRRQVRRALPRCCSDGCVTNDYSTENERPTIRPSECVS